jgi:PKD repeat protein
LMTAAPVAGFDSIFWSNGAMGASTYTTVPGQFIVDATDLSGCHAKDTVNIALYPQPQGNIIAPASCANEIANFSFNNTGTPISTYGWDFGDLTVTTDVSTSSSPSYHYPGQGIYGITLILTTANGCTDTIGQGININPVPSGAITNTAVCQDHQEIFNFTQTSTDSILQYAWDFPSGTPILSSDPIPAIVFNFAGPINVSVIITNQYGCKDTVFQPFIVRAHPESSFGVYPICVSRFTFDPQVSPDDNNVVLDWNLGDGYTSNDADTSYFNHIYAAPGDYNASLVVTDQYGCQDSITQVVHVDDSLFIDMPNVLVQTSTMNNQQIDMDLLSPGFNLCVNWTYTVFDRWGVKVFQAKNDPYNPDLTCANCFKGKAANGALLTPGIYYYVMEGNYNILKSGAITIFE